MNAIETVELSKVFMRQRRPSVVVDRLNLAVPKGQVFGLIGPNGSGKTTTIRMLCGVVPPSSGAAVVAGIDLGRPDQIKTKIGYANQAASLYGELTVRENLEFKAALYLPNAQVMAAAQRTMDRLGLARHSQILARQLSGGWRQRLLLGTAVVHSPEVVFLDEPTAAVDPLGRRELWDALYDLTSDGTTVFVSTHYMEEAERCHRVALIFAGKLLTEGKSATIRAAIKGHFYCLEAENLNAALRVVRAWDQVEGFWISGNVLRFKTHVALQLERHRVFDRLPEVAIPTLEDAFVDLVRAQERP